MLSRTRPTLAALVASATFLPLAGCGNTIPTSDTTAATVCSAGAAQIAVGDGTIQTQCGCAEGSQLAGPGTSVTCTVPSGTIVVFEYLGTTLKHQIVPTGSTLVIPASPICDPTDRIPTRTYAFQLTAAGSYPFEDAFDAGLSGNIVVTP